jgi:hypothetical protein
MNRLLWYCFWAPLYHLLTFVLAGLTFVVTVICSFAGPEFGMCGIGLILWFLYVRFAWYWKPLRIPVKWSGDSGDVGQHRSEATLGCSYISEVDHLSQESGQVECNHHHFVSWSPESREGAFR